MLAGVRVAAKTPFPVESRVTDLELRTSAILVQFHDRNASRAVGRLGPRLLASRPLK